MNVNNVIYNNFEFITLELSVYPRELFLKFKVVHNVISDDFHFDQNTVCCHWKCLSDLKYLKLANFFHFFFFPQTDFADFENVCLCILSCECDDVNFDSLIFFYFSTFFWLILPAYVVAQIN